MLVVGITGRSGSGKSLVGAIYARQGYPVFYGDVVARELAFPGGEYVAGLAKAFGAEVMGPGGELDRKKLAKIAFNSAENIRLLNEITHPLILAEFEKRLEKARDDGTQLFFVDGAAIIGGIFQQKCDKIILVTAKNRLAISRIILRDSVSKVTAAERLNAQMSEEELLQYADYVIENNSGLKQLEEKAEVILYKLYEEEKKTQAN